MKISNVISNFDLISEVPSGISRLRTLFVEIALKGGLDHHSSRDGNGYPSHWRITPANEVLESRSGNSKLIKGKLRDRPSDGTFPGYSASGQDVWLDHWEHDGTAAILSAVGARCGKAFLAQGKWSAIANTHIIWISENDFLPEYAMLILNNENFWIRSGTAQPFVKVKATLEKKIAVPPLDEQKLILEKVFHFMQKCDLFETARHHRDFVLTAARNSAIDAISSAQTQEDFHIAWARIQKNWKVFAGTPDGIDALRGLVLDLAVTGRLSRQNTRTKHSAMREPDLSKTSWGKYAPPEWNLTTLGDSCLKISDGTHKTPNYTESGVPFLSIKDISGGKIDFSRTRYISQAEHDELCKRIKPSRGDVLFCRIGTLGRAITIETDQEFSIFVSLGLLRPKPVLNSKYLEIALNSPISHKQFDSIKAGGSHTQKLNLNAMGKYIIWYPDLDTQTEIVNRVTGLMKLCDRIEFELKQKEAIAKNLSQSVVLA